MDFTKLLKLKYWFDVQPLLIHALQRWILIAIFSLLIIAGIVLILIAMKKDKILKIALNKISKVVLIMGLSGWLLLFFRWAGVYFLSARFWLGLWLIGLIIWAWRLIHYFKKIYPVKKQELIKQRQLKKYLP